MKVAILAGGKGTRLAEETEIRPKPMVEIGGKPIIWHIMRYYAHFGHREFIVALGHKSEYIKRWFYEFSSLDGDMTISTKDGVVKSYRKNDSDWTIHLVETGDETQTGGRIKRLQPWLGDDEEFMLTWGDGLSNVNLDDLVNFHHQHGKLATVTAAHPPARYGHLEFEGNRISRFTEKPQTAEGWINGAFFVLNRAIFDYIDGDSTQWEKEPLENLAKEAELMAFKHPGFWQCMDTLREKYILQTLWESGNAPWKVWEEQ